MKEKHFDHAIVGGGLIGLLTARELALAGQSVVVIDKGECGRESSWAGGGILSPLYPWRYSDPINALAKWSQRHYQGFCERLLEETGIDPQWTQCGILLLDEDEVENGSQWANAYGTTVEPLSACRIHAIEPGLSDQILNQGILFPDIAQVRNPRLLAALKASVTGLGVEIRENCPVEQFKVDSQAIVALSITGGEIKAANYILASGAWSGQLLSSVGSQLPIQPVKGQMLLYQARPGLLKHILMKDGHYLIPRRDGHVLVGSTLENAGFDKQNTQEAKEELQNIAFGLIPELSECPLQAHWAGLRPGTEDGIPYVGQHPKHKNLYINAGHFRNGVVLGLASAKLLLDLILEQEPIVDPNPYQLLG